jgi:hypothetical protein
MKRIISWIQNNTTYIVDVTLLANRSGWASNRSAHPHRSHRTLRDGSFGVRSPRHFVPGYESLRDISQQPLTRLELL